MTDLEKWQANAILQALHRVGRGQMQYTRMSPHTKNSVGGSGGTGDHTSSAPKTDKLQYLDVQVGGVSFLSIAPHKVRLWQSDYRSILEDANALEMQEIKAALGKSRYSAICWLHTPSGKLRNNKANPALLELLTRILRSCEVIGDPNQPYLLKAAAHVQLAPR
jgi:hypothetical protein